MTNTRISFVLCCALFAAACGDTTSPATPATQRPPLADVSPVDTGVPVALGSGIGANLCAQAVQTATPSGTAVVNAPCQTGSLAQTFTLNGQGQLTLVNGSYCLDVSNGGAHDGDAIIVGTCGTGVTQRWTHTSAAALLDASGKCLAVRGASAAVGTPLVVSTCQGGADQRWTLQGPPSAAAPTSTGWTYCTTAGATCTYLGLRDVRFGGPAGPYVQLTAYANVPCATYGFNNQNPAPGQSLHCDVGPLKTTTITNPMPGMGGLGATVTVPLGSVGASASQIATTTEQPAYTDGSGSFRTTCSLAVFAFNDPIVYPGQPGASHLHAFFGNTGVNASSTGATLTASGNSTCRGGTLNRTAYWVPAVVDARTGEVQTPDEAVIYYKTGYNVDPTSIQPVPAGLRMIAGNKAAASMADQPYGVSWGCRTAAASNTGAIPTTCPVGDAVRLAIIFPQCWDGVHLDASDHKSHMAFPDYRNPPERSTCPASHPIALPAITEHFDYVVSASSVPARWRLSSDMYSASTPGGFSAHADWMNGWDPTTMHTIVTQCLNRAVDCQVGLLGSGQTLY